MGFIAWLEATGLSIWMRESPSLFAYPSIIALHTVGMAFLAGASAVLNLRILGVAPRLPLAPMEGFFPVMWVGFWINAVSGVLLLIAYPTFVLINWLFYVKLTCIALAMVTGIRLLKNEVFRYPNPEETSRTRKAKILARASLVFWVGATLAGRWQSYIGYDINLPK